MTIRFLSRSQTIDCRMNDLWFCLLWNVVYATAHKLLTSIRNLQSYLLPNVQHCGYSYNIFSVCISQSKNIIAVWVSGFKNNWNRKIQTRINCLFCFSFYLKQTLNDWDIINRLKYKWSFVNKYETIRRKNNNILFFLIIFIKKGKCLQLKANYNNPLIEPYWIFLFANYCQPNVLWLVKLNSTPFASKYI